LGEGETNQGMNQIVDRIAYENSLTQSII
jgi:hypothetical protein